MSATSRHRHAPVAGILWMLSANACFSGMVTLFKAGVLDGASVPLALFSRAIFTFLALMPMVARNGVAMMATRHPYRHMLRCVAGMTGFGCTQWAVTIIGAADAIAISYSRPLLMIPIAATLLGERIGLRRALAALVGFAGVLVIVRPGASMHWASLLALAGGLGGVFVVIGLRLLAATEPPLRVVFWYAVAGCLVWGPLAFLSGALPGGHGVAMLLAGAVSGFVGDIMASHAARLAEASVLSPVEYAQIGFVALYAFLMFGERAHSTTWIGAALMFAATMAIAQDARRARRRAEQGP
ncbi:MAG: DMT family transporter [Alphaproteobacteria bacterium]|nr:DMT family transporter [Alphaproteobacteria bacterium]